MAKLRYKTGNYGVPILSATDIELRAEEVISYFNPDLLKYPTPIPLVTFMEKLHADSMLVWECQSDLGYTKHGKKILGKTQFKPLAISIDCLLEKDKRFKFVLGHELGHVVFHRKVDIRASGYDEQEISDTEYDFITGKKNLTTPRDWIEWQANRFASAILMPRVPVYFAVLTFQKEKGIVHNIGKVWLDNQPENASNFYFILEYLKKVFEVNATNVEYRLADLGILEDRRLMDVKHISELFMTE